MNLRKLCSIVAVLALSTSMVKADLLWTWSYTTISSGGDYTYLGSGSLTTADSTSVDTPFNDFYLIKSLSGSWTMNSTLYTITGLAPFDGGPQASNDNLLALTSTGTGQLDPTGVAFSVSISDPNLEFQDIRFNYGTDEYEAYTGYNNTTFGSGVLHGDNFGFFEATLIGTVPVPEPATNGAIIAGLLLAGLGLRRGFVKSRIA